MPREPMETTLIENTSMEKVINANGIHSQYAITPNDGYVLHDNRLDNLEYDENLELTGNVLLGYYSGTRTVAASYDFDNIVAGVDGNTTVNKIGKYELYAILATEAPKND